MLRVVVVRTTRLMMASALAASLIQCEPDQSCRATAGYRLPPGATATFRAFGCGAASPAGEEFVEVGRSEAAAGWRGRSRLEIWSPSGDLLAEGVYSAELTEEICDEGLEVRLHNPEPSGGGVLTGVLSLNVYHAGGDDSTCEAWFDAE